MKEFLRAARQYLVDVFLLPTRGRKIMAIGQETQAALTELSSSVSEVQGELESLAAQVEAGSMSDSEVAAAIRGQAQTLRDLRPDAPVDGPAEGPVEENSPPSE